MDRGWRGLLAASCRGGPHLVVGIGRPILSRRAGGLGPRLARWSAARRTFVYRFMRPDDFASAPIDFPGIEYEDGRLADGMQAKAAAHLIGALRGQGYEVIFQDAATDVTQAMQHVLWDRWTAAEVGEHEFIGQLFDDHGRIYHGCTAFDAASYTLQRLAALGGEIRSVHGP